MTQIATNNSTRSSERADARRVVTPVVDVLESREKIVLLADMPGVPREGSYVHIERGQLVLEGKLPSAEGEGAVVFRRVFAIPTSIDSSSVHAEMANGVLKVVLPTGKTSPRRVEVKPG